MHPVQTHVVEASEGSAAVHVKIRLVRCNALLVVRMLAMVVRVILAHTSDLHDEVYQHEPEDEGAQDL